MNSASYQVGSDLTVAFGKTYYWKVRDDASGKWSDYFKFTVEDIPPSDCTARFEFVQDGNQPDEVAPGIDVDLTWKIKNISDCDAVGYHLGFNSADPDGKNADYGGTDHPSFTIKANESDFVQANIRNTPEEEGEYRVEFDIYTNEDELLSSSSGGLTLFSEFTVTGDDPEPPKECTPSFIFIEDGYQPDPLEPGQAVDFTWKIKIPRTVMQRVIISAFILQTHPVLLRTMVVPTIRPSVSQPEQAVLLRPMLRLSLWKGIPIRLSLTFIRMRARRCLSLPGGSDCIRSSL